MCKFEHKVTAKWARETANDILGKKVLNEIEKCENTIRAAVKKNEMSCNIFIILDNLTKKEFTARGFEIEYHKRHEQQDSSYYEISL